MSAVVLSCGKVFDGISDRLTGPAEILVEGDRITEMAPTVRKPAGGARVSAGSSSSVAARRTVETRL